MWADRELEEEEQQYMPDHLLNHLTVKRAENNGGLVDGGHHGGLLEGGHYGGRGPQLQTAVVGGNHHLVHHQHHVASSGEYLDGRGGHGGRGNGVDMMEPMLAHMGDQVQKIQYRIIRHYPRDQSMTRVRMLG